MQPGGPVMQRAVLHFLLNITAAKIILDLKKESGNAANVYAKKKDDEVFISQ